VSAEKESKMSKRKINTKQLTQIKSVINHGKKRFYFRYYCPDLQKDNLKKFANTEAEARVLREQIKEKQVLGPSAPAGASTPIYMVREEWLDMMQVRADDGHLSQDTLNDYRNHHLSKLDPYEDQPVQTINSQMIREIFKGMVWDNGDPKSYSLKGKVYARIKAMTEFAIKRGYLSGDHVARYLSDAKPINVEPDEVQIPSEESVAKLIACSDEFWKPFFLMVASTGMRCGEAVALPWRNVRLNEGNKQPFIRIDSARKRNGKIGKPKTKKGIRELFLADQLAELFRKMPRNGELVFPMPEFQDKKLGSGKTYAPKRLRAENEYRLMSVEQVCHNGLKITVDKNQIEWPGYNGRGAPRIKCLRHFAASKMIALGHDVVSVQRRLGHASAQTTLDIYAHLWERNKFQDEAQDMMRGLI